MINEKGAESKQMLLALPDCSAKRFCVEDLRIQLKIKFRLCY